MLIFPVQKRTCIAAVFPWKCRKKFSYIITGSKQNIQRNLRRQERWPSLRLPVGTDRIGGLGLWSRSNTRGHVEARFSIRFDLLPIVVSMRAHRRSFHAISRARWPNGQQWGRIWLPRWLYAQTLLRFIDGLGRKQLFHFLFFRWKISVKSLRRFFSVGDFFEPNWGSKAL